MKNKKAADKLEKIFADNLTDNLSKEKLNEFQRLIEEGDEEKKEKFMLAMLPEIEKTMEATLKYIIKSLPK